MEYCLNWNFTAINSQLNSHQHQQQFVQQSVQPPQQNQEQHQHQNPPTMYHDMGYAAHSYATNYITTPYGAEMMNSNRFVGGGSLINGGGGDTFPLPSPSSQYFLYGGIDGRKMDFVKMDESTATTISSPNSMMSMVPINNNNSPSPFNVCDATTTMLHHAIHPMAMMQTPPTENRGTWYQPPIGTGSQSDTR